ncbi:MAG: GspH/FimT family pseudopilin [Pseudomonadota bacterium]|nr:GspH/FimT family pseudopilin [Pseudomonadota bacterium]
MKNQETGFTLIEAMLALLVATILLLIAVPAFSNAASAAHNIAARGALASSLLDAATHSSVSGSEVVVCAGSLRCSRDPDWSGGWIVFSDLNGNRIRDGSEKVLRQASPLLGEVRLRSTPGRTRLVFQPNGGNAGSNATFTLCDSRGVAEASTLVVANDGRMRTGTPTAAAAQSCVYDN